LVRPRQMMDALSRVDLVPDIAGFFEAG
jgi:hypothetical protein